MKNMVMILTLTILSSILSAQESKWDYPVKPGSVEWAKLITQDMKVNACQIPAEIFPQISTKELIDLCLNYPLLINITVFSTFQKGMDDLTINFNGISELYNRNDCSKLLMNRFIELSPKNFNRSWTKMQGGKFAFDFIALELFLSQKEVLDKLNKNELKTLLTNTIQKYNDKKELIDIYDQQSLQSLGYLIISIMDQINSIVQFVPAQEISDLKKKSNVNSYGNTDNLLQLIIMANDIIRSME